MSGDHVKYLSHHKRILVLGLIILQHIVYLDRVIYGFCTIYVLNGYENFNFKDVIIYSGMKIRTFE